MAGNIPTAENSVIKAIDKSSVHRITSGQVVIDLQTAVKELVENSLDAGATNIEVRFKHHGLKSVEVIDNGSGIPSEYHDNIDLATVRTFGFRGEALSSLCALSETLVVSTTTESPMGVSLEMDASGKVAKRSNIARQRGTTVVVNNLFKPLPVRRKEFERNAKREFGKALALLNAYALIGAGVRLTVSNTVDKGSKTVQLRTSGALASRDAVSELWGPKALDNIVVLDLTFEVERDKTAIRRVQSQGGDLDPVTVVVKGLISKFSVGGGRAGTDRQFFYVNGRPCNLSKIQKAFNEVYRSFNVNQAPFILADFTIPTDSCDINVSPDKRTIFLHSENNMIARLKIALEEAFATSRSTYDVVASQSQRAMTQSTLPVPTSTQKRTRLEPDAHDSADEVEVELRPPKKRFTRRPPSPRKKDGHSDNENGDNIQPLTMNPSERSRERCSSPGGCSVASKRQSRLSGTPMVITQIAIESPVTTAARHPAAWRSSPTEDRSPIATGTISARSKQDNDNDDDDHPTNANRDLDPSSDDIPPVLDTTAAVCDDLSLHKQGSTTVGLNILPHDSRAVHGKRSTSKVRQDVLLNTIHGFVRTGIQTPNVTASKMDNGKKKNVADKNDGEEEAKAEEEGSQDDEPAGEGGQMNSSDDLPPAEPRPLVSKPVDKNADITRPSSPIDVDVNPDIRQSSNTIDLTSEDGFDESLLSPTVYEMTSVLRHEEPVSRPEVIRTSDSDSAEITLRFDLNRMSHTWGRFSSENVMNGEVGGSSSLRRVPSDAGVSNTESDESAVKALARIIDKKDFATMDIVGQFNLGFILTRRRKVIDVKAEVAAAVMDDLFIVDQHAADEKYNFETLQQTTTINSQKLFKPQTIELTATDELVALENMDMLRQNGFEVEEVDGDGDVEMRQGARLRLTAQPISKSTVFDIKDLEELIHFMRDRPPGQMVRCSKARAMFAMRACRKSIMVGMPLNKQQMATVCTS
ncbi:hypothetical protein C0991_002039 [Blastosporella zonata]|nr:hypothetical protein C0991_002039 [Blastosporella zonata]